MIAVQLKGRLGNQMFQFAVGFALSRRLRCRLIFSGTTISRRLGIIGSLFLNNNDLGNIKMGGLLKDAYGIGPSLSTGRIIELSQVTLKSCLFKEYSPSRDILPCGHSYEIFDKSVRNLSSYTWLNGWFQSDQYFQGYEREIMEIFSPRQSHLPILDRTLQEMKISSRPTIGMHIRRGDYLKINNPIASPDVGWFIGREYYENAIKLIGCGYNYAIFSDDPAWAAKTFRHLKPSVSMGNYPVVDMFALSQCEQIITSNSSFSWWAGWLGLWNGSKVYAPNYHLGWRQRVWIPGGIETVGFTYLDVPE